MARKRRRRTTDEHELEVRLQRADQVLKMWAAYNNGKPLNNQKAGRFWRAPFELWNCSLYNAERPLQVPFTKEGSPHWLVEISPETARMVADGETVVIPGNVALVHDKATGYVLAQRIKGNLPRPSDRTSADPFLQTFHVELSRAELQAAKGSIAIPVPKSIAGQVDVVLTNLEAQGLARNQRITACNVEFWISSSGRYVIGRRVRAVTARGTQSRRRLGHTAKTAPPEVRDIDEAWQTAPRLLRKVAKMHYLATWATPADCAERFKVSERGWYNLVRDCKLYFSACLQSRG